MASRKRSIVPVCGAAAVLISLFGILGAIALSPWFSLHANALSDLGRVDRPSAPVFNGALIASGVLGMGFLIGVYREAAAPLERIGIALFGVAALSVVLIGLFPSPHSYHLPAAVGFYIAMTVGLFTFGSSDALAGRVTIGLTTIWLGIVHLSAWLLWWAVADGNSIALPEVVGALVFSTWIGGTIIGRYPLTGKPSIKG